MKRTSPSSKSCAASSRPRRTEQGIKLTPLAFIMRACVQGAAAVPALQLLAGCERREPDPEEVRPHRLRRRHAQRADGAGGPATPTARTSTSWRARSASCRRRRARASCTAAQMQGGCFTISSLGGIGGTAFTPDHQCAGSGDPGRVALGDEAGLPGRRLRAAADAAAVAVLRSSRHRWRAGGALHDASWRRCSPSRARCSRRCRELHRSRRVRISAISRTCRSSMCWSSAGDSVEVETPLITLETDKATMDVPATAAGTVTEVLVQARRQGLQGHADRARGSTAAALPQRRPQRRPRAAPRHAHRRPQPAAAACSAPARRHGAHAAPAAVRRGGRSADAGRSTQLLVLGAGPGGYTAAFRAADLGLKVTLDRALGAPGRRVPERRLHSFQGAAACGQGHRGSRSEWARTASPSASRSSIWRSCAPGRARRQEAHRRPDRAGQAAQGRSACAAPANFVEPARHRGHRAPAAPSASASSTASSRPAPRR